MEQEAINQRGGSRRGEGEAPAALWAGTAAGGAQRRETGSRGLLLTKAAIGAGAGVANRIVRAKFAGAASHDMRRYDRLNCERGALVDDERAALEAGDGGLIKAQHLAHFDLRQPKPAPDISEVVHERD